MKNLEKRIILCYIFAVVMLFVCVLRVCFIAVEPKYSAAAKNESSRVVKINFSRGTIFDSDMERITNKKNVIYAIIFNNPSAIVALSKYFSIDQTEQILSEIKTQGYAIRTVNDRIDQEGIYCFSAFLHADDSLVAKHTVGYVDSNGRGVCGIEAAFDTTLSGEGYNTISFGFDGRGNLLSGEKPTINYNFSKENSGVKTTLNTKIQQIVEQESVSISTGAVIVTEVKTGKIRAMVSRPDYKLSNLYSAVESSQKPLLNRALYTYNIGSVFKPFVAAAGFEEGVEYFTGCKGYKTIDKMNFTCHKISGHGSVDIGRALKYSCNVFFYEFIQKLGAESVISIAKKAGFESNIYLAKGIVAAAGSLGNTSSLSLSNRALANFSIGQGELMLSPLAITNFYMAIANGGEYKTPSLIEGLVENGKLVSTETESASVRVMSSKTANLLKSSLAEVLLEGGTGEQGAPTLTSAAGKTGTAQTGIVKNGKKVTNSWFCGFFPLEEPKYAVTLLWENSFGGVSSVFASIADQITKYELDFNY